MIIKEKITKTEFCKIFLKHFQILYQRPEISKIKIKDTGKSNLKIDQDTIFLNKKVYENSNPSASLIIFLHDLYHEYKQNITGYSQMLIMKKFYGDMALVYIDIDVDLRMFKYFNFTFENYLKIFFEEPNTIFSDVGGEYKNLTRLISSLLTLYIYSKTGRSIITYVTYEEDLENIYILSLENMNFEFGEFRLNVQKLVEDFCKLSTTRKNYQIIYPHLVDMAQILIGI